jgi:hypothetical protein
MHSTRVKNHETAVELLKQTQSQYHNEVAKQAVPERKTADHFSIGSDITT